MENRLPEQYQPNMSAERSGQQNPLGESPQEIEYMRQVWRVARMMPRGGLPQTPPTRGPVQANWILATFGQMELYNGGMYLIVSKEELRTMRNQGQITERDFLGALGYPGPNSPAAYAELGNLDQMRPVVCDSLITLPHDLAGRTKLRFSTQYIHGHPVHLQQQQQRAIDELPVDEDLRPSLVRRPRSQGMNLLMHDPLHRVKQLSPDSFAHVMRVQPKGDAEGTRKRLRPGKPQWRYLKTTVRRGDRIMEENYFPGDGQPISGEDFLDVNFCNAVNRWYRRIHRETRRDRRRDQGLWSGHHVLELADILRTHGNKSWEAITYEFNRRLGMVRSVRTIKAFVATDLDDWVASIRADANKNKETKQDQELENGENHEDEELENGEDQEAEGKESEGDNEGSNDQGEGNEAEGDGSQSETKHDTTQSGGEEEDNPGYNDACEADDDDDESDYQTSPRVDL